MILREGPSGTIIEGAEDGDILIWDESLQQWFPGPGGGTDLPEGDYDGQPLEWTGSEWFPLTAGDPLRFTGIELPPDTSAFQIVIDHPTEAYCEMRAVGDSSRVILNAVGGGTVDVFSDHPTSGVTLKANGATGTITLRVGESDLQALTVGFDGAAIVSGFFGATPVTRPIITGATEQEQIDSLVDALVALGLVEDGR